MNKLFTKIVSAALGLTMAIGVGLTVASNSEAVPVHAANGSVTLTTSFFSLSGTSYMTKSATDQTSGVTFNVTDCNVNSGLNMKKITGEIYNSTAFSNKKITSVVLDGIKFSSASSAGFYVYGGTSSKPSNLLHENSGSTTKTTVDFSSNNYTYFYIKNKGTRTTAFSSVVINYTDAASDYVGSLSVSPSTWTGFDSQTLSVSSFTVSGSKNGTAGAVTSSDYEFKGIGYMSGDNFVARDASFSSGNPTTADKRLAWKAKYPTTLGGSTYAWAYVTLTVTADSVNSIVVSGSMTKTTYSQGDAWDPAGFTVKAYYASAPSAPVDVTNNAGLSWTYSPATTASTSTTSVTCTASFGGQSATSSAQSVTVNEKQNIGGIVDGEKYFIISTYSDSERYLKAFDSAPGAPTTSNGAWPGDANMPSEDTDAWTFTSAGSDDTWVITSQAGKTLYATATNNGLGCTSSGDDEWTISEPSSGVYKMQAKNSRYLTVYQTSNWRVYTSTTGQGEDSSTIRFVKYEEPVTLDSLTVATPKTSFTVGDNFSLGSAVITASYSDGTDVVVPNNDSGLSFKLNNVSITMSTQLSRSNNAQSLVITYTDSSDRTKSATGYAITVDYATVSSLSLASNTGKVALNEYFDMSEIGVTILPSNANQGYEWTVLSNTVNDDFEFDADIVAAKDTAGTITLKCTSTADSSKYQTFVLTVSGNPVVTLPNSVTLYTGKTTTVTASVEGGTSPYTYSWSITSGGSYASISSGGSSATVTLSVSAAGSVTLQCSVTDSNSKSDSASVTFSVIASAVTEVNWSASAFDVFSGATIPSNIDDTWGVNYEKNNGDADYITFGDYELYVGSKEITSLPYTFVAEDDGESLHVEYGGVSSSPVAVAVTQTLQAVMASDTSAWDYTFSANVWSAAGEKTIGGKAWTMSGTDDGSPYFGYDATKGQQFGSGAHPYSALQLSSSDFSGTINSVTVYTSGAKDIDATVQVSVGGTAYGSAQSITASNAGYTFDLGGKSGTISIDWVNSSSKAIYIKEIVVNTVSGSTNIANVAAHKAAQRVAVKFAKAFNAAMDTTSNCTTNLSTAWATCSSAYNTFKTEAAALGSAEEAYAKNLIKYATAQYFDDSGETCIERMMKTYEICVQKHGQTAFMSELVTLQAARVTPLASIVGNSNTIAIIVVISMISITAIGGYFFLRRRKEN